MQRERERERKRERRDRQTDTERDRETDRQTERKTAKGKNPSEEKGLWHRPLRISLPCWYLVQILSLVYDWLLN